MNISLTPALEAFVREKVDSGLYGNASEVIREALRLMIQRDAAAAGPRESKAQKRSGPATKSGRPDSALRELEDELRARGITSVALFGAAAKGEDQPGSRIDILIDAAGDFSRGDQIAAAAFLEEQLGRPVELMTRNAIDPVIRDVLLMGARKIF